jgi:hypothetical protein
MIPEQSHRSCLSPLSSPLPPRPSFSRRLFVISLLVLVFAGSGTALLLSYGRTPSDERFIPPEDEARAALETALTTWREGNGLGSLRLEIGPPAIQVIDSFRRSGQLLRSFEVLGRTSTEGPHRFAVRLLLDRPREEKNVRYVIVGDDPLWVVREEDFEMMERWQMPMGNGVSEKKAKK